MFTNAFYMELGESENGWNRGGVMEAWNVAGRRCELYNPISHAHNLQFI